MRLKRRAHLLGMFVLISTTLAGLLVLLFYTNDIRERTISGEIGEGMWGPFELERHFWLMRAQLDQIQLGAQIPLKEYQKRRSLALSRVIAAHHLAQDNPTFDPEQVAVMKRIDESFARFKAFPADTVPDAATAQAMLPVVDQLLEDAHTLLNLRRQVENLARANTSRSVARLNQILATNIIFLIAVGLGFYWLAIREARATEQTHRQLQANAEQAAELAQTKERTRLAREIHDGLGHHISIIHMKLGAAIAVLDVNPNKARQVLEQVEYLTQEALDDIRESVDALRSLPNEQPSLVEAFSRLATEWTDAGVPTSLRINGTPRVLPEEVERTLYRVAQEALTNVRKHAQASQVDVSVVYGPNNTVNLIIEDNGKGALIREDGLGVIGGKGYGLQGMRERVESEKGAITFTSSLNAGFIVEVEVLA